MTGRLQSERVIPISSAILAISEVFASACNVSVAFLATAA
ncbi:hypothetical protein XMM379_003141 [Aliiroseovarius sp. xm-m-379]|nr:hypothetical protein [Aliiroseovarius sp. xm-m-379]